MFNFTSDMLLESSDSIIGSSINHSKLIGGSHFLTGITQVQETQRDYNLAKAALYTALSESSTDDFKAYFSDAYERSFPKKPDYTSGKSLTEATDSTTAFVKYFGDSIQILNKAIGNIADAANGIKNQVPVQKSQSSKIIEACEKVKSDCHCPACGTSPCTCNKSNKEHIFKYDTTRGIPMTKIDFSVVDKGLAPGTDFGKLYDSITESTSEDIFAYRSALCGLDESIEVPRAQFNKSTLNSFMSSKRYDVAVNKDYLDYCAETVLSFEDRVDEVKKECKKAAQNFSEAVDRLTAIKNGASTYRYIREDGCEEDIDKDQAQDLCLAGKAKTDELVAKCNDTLTTLSAKVDAMQSEFDQCKAVISKYSLGNDQPIALPQPPETPQIPDGTIPPTGSINEEPDEGAEDGMLDGEYPDEEGCCGSPVQPDEGCGEGDDISEYDNVDDESEEFDYDPEEPYAESLVSFALDAVLMESQFNDYVNNIIGESVNDDVFTEGVIGALKTGVQKVMQFLKNAWAKFINSMKGIFENDVKYLAENKNIILGNKPKAVSIENWYNYDINKINTAQLGKINSDLVQITNPNELSNILKGPNGQTVKDCADEKNGISNVFKKYFSDFDNPNYANTVDKFKAYFNGGGKAVTINASTFDQKQMQAMYEYCYNFMDKTKKTLQEDIDNINNMSDTVDSAIQQLENIVPDEKTVEAEKQADAEKEKQMVKDAEQGIGQKDPSNTGDTTVHATNSQVPLPKESIDNMASIFDTYFSESPTIGNTPADTATQNKDNPTKAAVGTLNAAQQKNSDAATNAGAAKDTTKQDVAIMKQYYLNVFKVTKDFATTRMTIAESAYRDFMKFIRWHVGQYAVNAKQDQQGDVVTQQPQQTQQQNDDNKITTPA